ncbi:hypothetical protein Tco_0016211 [Tanacetum coccineum]
MNPDTKKTMKHANLLSKSSRVNFKRVITRSSSKLSNSTTDSSVEGKDNSGELELGCGMDDNGSNVDAGESGREFKSVGKESNVTDFDNMVNNQAYDSVNSMNTCNLDSNINVIPEMPVPISGTILCRTTFFTNVINKSIGVDIPIQVNDAQDLVMSSASSTVTYTSVDTNSEPGRAFWPADEELSDGGFPWVIDEDEREPMFVHTHDLDYVLEPIYPKHIPLEDEHVFPAEEQPLPPVDLPTALSPGYVADSDPKEDPEEDSEEEHADYPADGGDDDDDDDDDDTNDEDKEPFEEEEGDGCLDTPALPSSQLPRLPHPYGSPNYVRTPLGFRAAIGRLRASSPLPPLVPASLPLPSPPLPPLPSSPLPPLPDSLFIPPVNRREDILEAKLPPRKRLCLTTPASRYKVGESSTTIPRPTGGPEAVGYGIRDTWVDPRETAEEVAPITLEGVNTRVTKLVVVQEQDTQDIYVMIEDTQDRQTQIHQTVEALVDDRQYHCETARLLDQEALGHLATALGEIRALQAREQARVDVPEGTGSSS